MNVEVLARLLTWGLKRSAYTSLHLPGVRKQARSMIQCHAYQWGLIVIASILNSPVPLIPVDFKKEWKTTVTVGGGKPFT